MAVTHREIKDATLSGKQVKINKNRFLFPALRPTLPYFYVCIHVFAFNFLNKQEKSFFSFLQPSCTLDCVPNMVNIN